MRMHIDCVIGRALVCAAILQWGTVIVTYREDVTNKTDQGTAEDTGSNSVFSLCPLCLSFFFSCS